MFQVKEERVNLMHVVIEVFRFCVLDPKVFFVNLETLELAVFHA